MLQICLIHNHSLHTRRQARTAKLRNYASIKLDMRPAGCKTPVLHAAGQELMRLLSAVVCHTSSSLKEISLGKKNREVLHIQVQRENNFCYNPKINTFFSKIDKSPSEKNFKIREIFVLGKSARKGGSVFRSRYIILKYNRCATGVACCFFFIRAYIS